MKPKKQILRRLSGHSSSVFGLCSITLCFLAAGQAMAQSTWTGGSNSKWNEAGNWNALPVANAILNFGGEPLNFPTDNDFVGLTTGAINLTNNGLDIAVVGPPAGTGDAAFTLGTLGQTVTLGGNINTTAIATGGVSLTDTINLSLILNANRSIGTSGGHNVTVNGNISETGGTRQLTKGGSFPSGTLTLTGNNTYTGFTVIETGTLTVSKIADSGDSNLGYGTQITMSFGNTGAGLNYNGSGGSTSRKVQLGSSNGPQAGGTAGGTITASGANGGTGLVFTAPTFIQTVSSTATSRTLNLQGANTDANQIQGVIVDVETEVLPAVTTATNVNKAEAGRWILSGVNTYTGTTTVSGGVLQIANATALPVGGILNLAGGVLGLGTGDFTRALGALGGEVSIGTSGGFAAYGADRSVNIGSAGATLNWNTTAPTITGTTIVLGASTATHTVTFVNPLNAGTGTRVIQANDGAAAVDGIMAGNITNTGNIISKTGAGTLQLNGTGNAWGNTFIDGGTLRLGAAGVLPDGTTLTVKRAGNTGNTDGKLDLAGNDETIGNLTLGSPSAEGNALSAGQNPSVVSSGSAATLTVTGGVTYDAGNASFLNGQATISANLVRSGNPFFTVGNGAAADDLVISGNISGSFNAFTKDGSGTLVLTGTNDYVPTATTNVNAGTLVINGDSSGVTKAFNVNGTSTLGGNGTVGGSVTVTTAANLSPGATGAVGTFSILGSLNISGQAGGTGKLIYALDTIAASDKVALATGVTRTLTIGTDVLGFSDFTFSTLAGLQNGTYKLIIGATSVVGTLDPAVGALTGTLGAGPAQGTLQFTGNDLELVVTGAPSSDPFEDWAGSGVNFDDDANNDGVKNGLAWLLGAPNKNVNATGKLPTVTQTGGNLKLTFDMLPTASRDGAQLFIEHSSNLGISDLWTGVLVLDATGGSAPVTFIVSDSNPGDPENPLDVEATISSTEAAAGKLFGRLKAVR